MKELVFGHKNPDTDAISAAISYSYLQNKLGYETEAVALGEPNEETKFVLSYFKVDTPKIITKAADKVKSVMLVDHNERQQSVSDISKLRVTHVIDHHRIANFETAYPLYYHAEPVGCTSTILLKEYRKNNVDIPSKIAGLMLSAIISDTLLLKSPTTTKDDKLAVIDLSKIAGVDYKDYGLTMLKAGANIDSRSDDMLISQDAKSFNMDGINIRIDQINTVDLDDVFSREEGLRKAIEKQIKENGYDLFLLMVTNILDSNTRLLVIGEPQKIVEEAFDKKIINGKIDLPGVVSRKKQIVPPLQAAILA